MRIAQAGLAAIFGLSAPLQAEEMYVGVSWSNFQEERWRTDEAAIIQGLDAAGAQYVSTDAEASATKQLDDVRSLIEQGVDALIVLAQDASSIGPALELAHERGIPVVGYDRLIEDPRVFYLTFDNIEVGRMQARAILEAQPSGRYVMIKGSPTDPNADFLRGGQQEILQAAISAGDITIVDEAYTDSWRPDLAQANMEAILAEYGTDVDAVVASNDGTAGGVFNALSANGLAGIPLSGQDGDTAALNRVALGMQTISVWKDARDLGDAAAKLAVILAAGVSIDELDYVSDWETPSGTIMRAMFLDPVPITRENLDVVVKSEWITQEALCAGVPSGVVEVCD